MPAGHRGRGAGAAPGLAVIRRYLLRELLSPLVASSVLLCTLFYVMAFLRGSDLLLGSGVTAGDLGRFALSMLPGFVVQVLPVAVLLAVLLGFGRLGEDGELSALFALGMRPRTFLRGPLLLGVGLGALMALLTFTLKPWGIALMRETARNVIRRNLVGDLQPGTFQEEIPGFTFYAQRIERGPTWRNVLLFDSREGQAPLLALAPVAHIDASSRQTPSPSNSSRASCTGPRRPPTSTPRSTSSARAWRPTSARRCTGATASRWAATTSPRWSW